MWMKFHERDVEQMKLDSCFKYILFDLLYVKFQTKKYSLGLESQLPLGSYSSTGGEGGWSPWNAGSVASWSDSELRTCAYLLHASRVGALFCMSVFPLIKTLH